MKTHNNHFRWLLLCMAASLLLAGCRLARPGQSRGPSATRVTQSRADAEDILVFMPDSKAAKQVLAGITEEMNDDYDIVSQFVSRRTSYADMGSALDRIKPSAVVLMNNPTVRLYQRLQASRPGSKFPPAVIVLSSFVSKTGAGVKNSAAISYEVPLVTSLVNLRALVESPVRKVGVLYRPEFTEFIDEQRRLAEVEEFELVGVELSNTAPREVRKALRKLTSDSKIDALWVLNDNVLLKARTVREGWVSQLNRDWVPTVVNVGSLVTRKLNFGTFAVLPDHKALGLQAANMLLELAADKWQLAERRVEYPISVETVLAVGVAKDRLRLDEGELARVDRKVR